MQENKYFSGGKPLNEICLEKGININSARTRIWKLRHNKKYASLSDEEIVDMVISSYGSAIKYSYNNMSLRKYCELNNLNYSKYFNRVLSLKKIYPDLSNDELVKLSIENYKDSNYRFFVNNQTLKEFCDQNPEYNYNTMRSFIYIEKKKNPSLSDEELIKIYINKENKGKYRYYYLGIPLKKYCEDNNLNYKNIITYIRRNRNKEKYEGLSDNDFVDLVMNEYEPFNIKYVYNGESLYQYCLKNSVSYSSVVTYVKRKMKLGSLKSIDELIDNAINTINRHGIIYYYNGVPLMDYASEHNLNIGSLRMAILRKKITSNKSIQEIVNECVESYIKYFYMGIPLSTYCKNIDVSYDAVVYRYEKYYQDVENISFEDAIDRIINDLKIHHDKYKYYFNKKPLYYYCAEKRFNYNTVSHRIYMTLRSNPLLDTNVVVKSTVEKHIKSEKIRKNREIFNLLKKSEVLTDRKIRGICNFLKIDYESLNDLLNGEFSLNQAVNLLWHFSDNVSENGRKMITDKKLESVLKYARDLDYKKDLNLMDLDFYTLFAIYKCELYDTREILLKREQSYMGNIIRDVCLKYNIDLYSNYKEFIYEAQCNFLLAIEKYSGNIPSQFNKFVQLTIKGNLLGYMKANYLNLFNISHLEDKIGNNHKGRDNRTLHDIVGTSDKSFDDNLFEGFSPEMLKLISVLDNADLKFIQFRYQENFSDEELAKFYGISLDDVKAMEQRILSIIRDNADDSRVKKTN